MLLQPAASAQISAVQALSAAHHKVTSGAYHSPWQCKKPAGTNVYWQLTHAHCARLLRWCWLAQITKTNIPASLLIHWIAICALLQAAKLNLLLILRAWQLHADVAVLFANFWKACRCAINAVLLKLPSQSDPMVCNHRYCKAQQRWEDQSCRTVLKQLPNRSWNKLYCINLQDITH